MMDWLKKFWNRKQLPKVPRTLDECFDVLGTWDDMVAEMKNMKEGDVVLYHHSAGRWIRNNWGLWQGENYLCRYFKSIGITHADDMSGIIFTSFYRKLHGKPLDIDGQVAKYKAHWEKYGGNRS